MGPAGGPALTTFDPGIRRLGVVIPGRLWRGGRVRARGIDLIANLGCRRVIDLTRRPRPTERRACDRNGLEYCKVPLDDRDAPPPGCLDAILDQIIGGPPVLIHCWGGRHRTGLVIAAYRVRVMGWPGGRARTEMASFGFGDPSRRPGLWGAVPCR